MAGASNSVSQSLGIPPGTKWYSPYPFAGMNQLASPTSMSDQEFQWVENFLRLGDGKLRTAWDIGSPLYSVSSGATIVKHFWYTIGTIYYVAVFLSDGSAVQVDMSGNQTVIGNAGLFYLSGGSLPGCASWGTQYLLISNRNTGNDYWVWDGSLLYSSGSVAPNGVTITSGGSNYTSTPTITVYGGSGSGLVVVPTIVGGSVANLQITNPGSGWKVGETPQLLFSGGGSDAGAEITAQIAGGGVTAVTVIAGGSGYTSASVSFSGGGGTGAAATPIIGSGVTSVTVTAGGSGYTTPPLVGFTGGGGSGATAVASIVGGIVTAITVTNPGSGYTSAPGVTFTGGGGTSAAATAAFQIGVIVGVNITAAGTGYTSAPAVSIAGTGSSASAQAFLQPGGVTGLTIVNPGSGFTSVPILTLLGGGGTDATAVAQLTGTSVATINITSGGTGYETPPTVGFQVNQDAVSPIGTAVLQDGSVVGVTLTNAGSGITSNVYVYFTTGFTGSASDGTLAVAPGSGATAQAVLVPTTIASATVVSTGSGYTTAPAVVLSSTGNNAATATLSLMPFGTSGAAINTYQQRVWIANPAPPQFGTLPPGGNFSVSAPGSLTDYATSDGAVDFTNSDGFLQTKYTAIHQSNGYLYVFGDGSVSIISSVNTSGNPATTTFNYQNVDPQVGALFPESLQDYGKTILFANETGVYGIYGGSATLASAKLNDLVETLNYTTGLTPSSASATLFNVKHYLLLATVTDTILGTPRNVMLTWNEKDWVVTSQSASLTYIATQKVGSKLYAWGTDGTHLYPLFNTPSTTLTKRLDSKLYGGGPNDFLVKDLTYMFMQAQDQSASQVGIDATVTLATSGITPQSPFVSTVPSMTLPDPWVFAPSFPAAAPNWPLFATKTEGVSYISIQAQLTTTSPDFILADWRFAYQDVQAFMG